MECSRWRGVRTFSAVLNPAAIHAATTALILLTSASVGVVPVHAPDSAGELAPAGVEWTRLGIVLGPSNTFDAQGAMNPFVMKEGNSYKMWYRGFDGTHNRLLYATSTDGIAWTTQGVVVDVDSPPHYFDSVGGLFVMKLGDTYVMWFHGGYWAGPFGLTGAIYRAESRDGSSWIIGDVALDLGPTGAWDGANVGYPMVVRGATGEFRMYYAGWNGTTLRIGLATSGDGLFFRRTSSVPILNAGPTGAWDDDHVTQPFVTFGSPWTMRFMGYDGNVPRIGQASSPDGFAWTKAPDNPEFGEGPAGSWDSAGAWGESLLADGSDLYMYYTGFDGLVNRIGLARRAGPVSTGNVDCDPDAINRMSGGRWITCYLEPSSGFSAGDLVALSVHLDSWLSPVLDDQHGFTWDPAGYLVDHDGDGIAERLLKFDRQALSALLTPGLHAFLVEGEMSDGSRFSVVGEPIHVI